MRQSESVGGGNENHILSCTLIGSITDYYAKPQTLASCHASRGQSVKLQEQLCSVFQ